MKKKKMFEQCEYCTVLLKSLYSGMGDKIEDCGGTRVWCSRFHEWKKNSYGEWERVRD